MKGFTTDKQLGKRDGRRYYQQKGVEGIVSASINQGMSSRVKNDAAYANTRLNNAEFGAAGSTAGAITRSLSQKWRYLLVPFAAGKLAKDVRALMMDDTTNPWGQRSLQGTDWQKVLAEKVSQYSKNPVSDYDGLKCVANFDAENGMTMRFSNRNLTSDILAAKGVDGVIYEVLAYDFTCSNYDTAAEAYAGADVLCIPVVQDDIDLGDELPNTIPCAYYKQTAQASNKMYAMAIIIKPYKEVNGEKHILQELCSFQMAAAEPAV